jgi:hypothetical protein
MKGLSGERASSCDRLYWGMVEATLTEVFEVDPPTARERVEHLIHRLATLSPETQEFAFHAEPLSVAADLLRRDYVTERDVELYDDLAERLGWSHEAQSEPALQLSNS